MEQPVFIFHNIFNNGLTFLDKRFKQKRDTKQCRCQYLTGHNATLQREIISRETEVDGLKMNAQ
jgi:hypothetical protein